MKHLKVILGIGLLAIPQATALGAERPTFDFEQVWSLVRENSPGRVYSTNDPAMSFMGILEQRQIGVADFAPAAREREWRDRALQHRIQSQSRGILGAAWAQESEKPDRRIVRGMLMSAGNHFYEKRSKKA